MFEPPEFATLARQMNETVSGLTITEAIRGNTPHKFGWYNREPGEFAALAVGKHLGLARSRGKWLFLPFEPG